MCGVHFNAVHSKPAADRDDEDNPGESNDNKEINDRTSIYSRAWYIVPVVACSRGPALVRYP